MRKKERRLVFLLCALVLAIGILCPIDNITWAKTDKDTYYSNKELTEDQMSELFLKGYKTIINKIHTRSNLKAVHSATISSQYARTTCVSISKRGYGLIGYSKKVFGGTSTFVTFPIPSTSISLSFSYKGLSVGLSIPTQSGEYGEGLSIYESEKKKIRNNTHRSCLKMEGFLTVVTYKTEILDSLRRVTSTKKKNYTYYFNRNKKGRIDYSLITKSIKEIKEIRNNKYVGTNKEKKKMNKLKWTTTNNPKKVNLKP